MAQAAKQLEDGLQELGSKLASPPDEVGELQSLLDKTDGFLSRVEQSPSQSMLTVLKPLMDALVAKELLSHSDVDVKVAVASCISEITRITAPDAPYDDELMKEIFEMIVEAFEQLHDTASPSFSKRVSILETVAKVRSCVVMLDLECDGLILEMFRHFLKTIRSNHPENVFSSMETIMTLVIEESEDISSDLLSCLLDCLKKDNEDVPPIACRLVEKVMGNCAMKIRPYLQSIGGSLSGYNKFVASICQDSSDALEQTEVNVSGEILADDSKLSERTVSDELPQASAKMDQEVACPEKVGAATDNSLRTVMSNGTVQMRNGDSIEEPSSPKQKSERARLSDQSKSTVAANRADSDNLESATVKSDSKSDLNAKKVRGRKTNSSIQLTDTTDHSRNDSDKEASAVTSRRKGRSKEADSLQSDPQTGKELEAVCLGPEKKNEHPLGSDNAIPCVASSTPSETLPDTVRPKRGRPSGSKAAAKRNGINAIADRHGSASGQKGSLGSSQTQDELLPAKDVDSKKETQGSESEGKPRRRSGKKVHSENNVDVEGPATVISDSEAKIEGNTGRRGYKGMASKGESSGRKQKSNVKQQGKDVTPEKDTAGEPTLKEMVSSPTATVKAPSKDDSHLGDSANAKVKSRGKRARATEEISETPDEKGESIVGSRIKVWWPDDDEFYKGVVKSFDPVKKKHKIVYDDGDTEDLVLKEERWEFVVLNRKTDGGQAKDIPSIDAVEMSPGSKAKQTSRSAFKHSKVESLPKSGTQSRGKDGDQVIKRKGRPRSNPGKLASDDSSRKLRGKAASKEKEDETKFSSKFKDGLANKSKETRGFFSRTKDETRKASGKSQDDTPKSGKDESLKSGRKSKYETPKAKGKNSRDDAIALNEDSLKANLNKDDVASVGSKSITGSARGRKRKGSNTSRSGGESTADGTSDKGKLKIQESEKTSEEQGIGARTGKKRKRRL